MAWINERRGLNNQQENYEFAKSLGEKYNYEVIFQDTNKFLCLQDWLSLLSQFKFIINIDRGFGGGQVPIESAILEVIHFGGLTNGAICLWPQTAIIDKGRLDFEFYFLHNDNLLQEKTIKDTLERVKKYHSFENTYKKLQDILND